MVNYYLVFFVFFLIVFSGCNESEIQDDDKDINRVDSDYVVMSVGANSYNDNVSFNNVEVQYTKNDAGSISLIAGNVVNIDNVNQDEISNSLKDDFKGAIDVVLSGDYDKIIYQFDIYSNLSDEYLAELERVYPNIENDENFDFIYSIFEGLGSNSSIDSLDDVLKIFEDFR